jgi:flagellar hook assembly protein FlgD
VNLVLGEVRRIVNTTAVGVPEPAVVAGGVSLAPPWPSPSRGAVALAYTLPAAASVTLEVFGLDGRRVRVLEAGAERAAARHVVRWDGRAADGSRVPAGVYYARLHTAGAVRSQRIVLLP